MSTDDAEPEGADPEAAGPDTAGAGSAPSGESPEEDAPSSSGSGRLRLLGWAAVVVVGLAAPLGMRVSWEGRAELEAADRARAAGEVDLEVEHLGRAARWRLPLADHDEVALERLVALGAAAESVGSDGSQEALTAYREARRAILATRTWGVPHPEIFERVNERIARLMADQEARFETDVGGTGDPYRYHLGLLQDVPGPDPVRANLAAFAFVGWLVATGGFVMRSLDARGRLRPKTAVRWGVASVVLLIGWMVALRFAG